MKHPPQLSLLLTGVALVCAAAFAPRFSSERKKLAPLFEPMGKPGAADWLNTHQEPGQTYAEWLLADPVLPDGRRRVIYIQPLGEFPAAYREVLEDTVEFIGLFYQPLEVRVLPRIGLEGLPADARRRHPLGGLPQVHTGYLLHQVLAPRLPGDGVCVIGLTTEDLFPGPGWNFVFGQASIRNRVGVWSLHRFGDPAAEDGMLLRRTCKTAVHEIGHMFTMRHCVLYECGMAGSNHLAEADRRPVAFCPECVSKVWTLTGAHPVRRYLQLEAFSRERGLEEWEALYRDAARALRE